jgi:imidazolonepropionase-like amidohydrolase
MNTPIVAVVGGTLLDVVNGHQLQDSIVLVAGDRIQQVGKRGELTIPPGAPVVEAHGKWIIPGLMDMHAHIAEKPTLPLDLYLANGVTTIRDPGGNVTRLRLTREALDSGTKVGPRLFFAGNILDGNPPVWPEMSLMADTPRRAESVVNYLADQGVDCIKIYNHITEDVLVAIVRIAHARELPVIGHVPRVVTTTRAIELGMDCLEHIRVTGREILSAEDADKIDFLPIARREPLLWQRYDLASDKLNRLIGLIATTGIFLDPTLIIDELTSVDTWPDSPTQQDDPNNRFLPPQLVEEQSRRQVPEIFKRPPELNGAAAEGFEKRIQFVGMCSRAGVRIITGTDGAGLGALLAGFGLQRELALLARSGLSPLQIIQASTITSAHALRRENELGSVDAGKFADLLLLDGDPLADIGNAARVHRVMKGGQVYDPAVLLREREATLQAVC